MLLLLQAVYTYISVGQHLLVRECTLPSATPASDTPDDLPNLSLSSDNLDLSASLYFPDNLDDPSNSVDLTWTDLDEILSSEPFASSTPSPKTTVQTPTHAFHPLANTITSHTSSHRYIVFSHIPPLQLLHLHAHHSHTDASHHTLHLLLLHLLLFLLLLLLLILPSIPTTRSCYSSLPYTLTSVTDTSARFPPSIQAMLFTLSHSPFYPPNLPPPDQMTVSEFSNAILAQLFQHFHTPHSYTFISFSYHSYVIFSFFIFFTHHFPPAPSSSSCQNTANLTYS